MGLWVLGYAQLGSSGPTLASEESCSLRSVMGLAALVSKLRVVVEHKSCA